MASDATRRRHAWTIAKAEYLRDAFAKVGNRYTVSELEPDEVPAPSGTSDYDGRVLTFMVTEHDMTWRVIVEDISADTEVRN